MSHIIVVTEAPNEERDDPIFTVEGECDSSCEAWWECLKEWHRHPKNAEWGDEWSTKGVPELHQFLNYGAWCVVNPNTCGAHLAFEQGNYDDELSRVGVYDVTVNWDDHWWLSLSYRGAGDPGDTERSTT